MVENKGRCCKGHLDNSTDGAFKYYNPRYYHKTQLYQIVKENLAEFLSVYSTRFAEEYGELRPRKKKCRKEKVPYINK